MRDLPESHGAGTTDAVAIEKKRKEGGPRGEHAGPQVKFWASSDEQKSRWKEAADSLGTPFNQWIRETLDKRAARVLKK